MDVLCVKQRGAQRAPGSQAHAGPPKELYAEFRRLPKTPFEGLPAKPLVCTEKAKALLHR